MIIITLVDGMLNSLYTGAPLQDDLQYNSLISNIREVMLYKAKYTQQELSYSVKQCYIILGNAHVYFVSTLLKLRFGLSLLRGDPIKMKSLQFKTAINSSSNRTAGGCHR